MDKLIIFSAFGDGDIESSAFPDKKSAQQAMFRAYVTFITGSPFEESKYKDLSFPECLEEIKKDECLYTDEDVSASDIMWITEDSAYFYSDRTWKEYAWSVKEFPVGNDSFPVASVQTKLGDILVNTLDSENYPGVQVSLQKNADEPSVMLAWVEVDQSADECNPEPAVKVHTYSVDPEKNEPIFNYVAKEKDGQLADAVSEEEE